ncbi:hypothetical protein Scep_003931 [Stephania cephalantha]|uniref:Uncharacterized protein n=1 Tax=Stephania cephalantha TaxID=152367 RepID=A0AAP0PUW0_9MAGN
MMAHSFSYAVFLLLSLHGVQAGDDSLLEDTAKVVDGLVPCPSCEERKIHVVVEGVVLCQSCSQAGTSSLADSTPIQSAVVSVTCNDQTDYFPTDSNGHFYAEIAGYKVSDKTLEEPLQTCRVRLDSSPLPNCNQQTDINNGIDGASLRSENKRISSEHYQAAIYAAGPVAFRPAQC